MTKAPAYFSGVFGRSPFPTLQKHGVLCAAAAKELLLLVPAAGAGAWDEVEQHYGRLTELEHKADKLKRKIRRNLPRGFFLPVARADILDLLSRQDEIANGARDVGGLMFGRRMQFPSDLQPTIMELTVATVATCVKASKLVSTFDELLDSGFSGFEAKRISGMIEEVEELEERTDEIVVSIRSGLFEVESELPPVQAVFFYKALDKIADLADVAERVAHRVQMMVAK